MVKSMYAGISGMRTHQAKMDVIGNNIANVNTFGYKSARTVFKESLYTTVYSSSDGNLIYGGGNASQVGYGSQVASIDLAFSTGAYAPTDSPTDCMIDGNGFFIVGPKVEGGLDLADPNAIKSVSLSRVGNFTVDGDGYLVDSNKQVVYGYGPELDADGFPLLDDDGNVVLNQDVLVPIQIPEAARPVTSIRIDDKGNVIGIASKTTGTAPDEKTEEIPLSFGRLALANVQNPNALEKTQGPYYRVVANTGEIAIGEPGTKNTGLLIPGGLEMANVDLAKEFAEMITTQRGFQANSKIITVTDEMLAELVNLKR